MKAIWLSLILGSMQLVTLAQNFCDSTYRVCDSLRIDSAKFIHDAVYGDKIWLDLHTDHDFLYAPEFLVCPDEDISFEDASYGFFSIYGPAAMHVLYYFSDAEYTGPAVLDGRIINDNSNNLLENCVLPFSITVTSTDEIASQNEDILDIYPNPVHNILHIAQEETGDDVLQVNVYGLNGNIFSPEFASNGYDMTALPAGLYTVVITLQHSVAVKRIVKM